MATNSPAVQEAIKLPGVEGPLRTQLITHLEGYGNYTRVYVLGQSKPLIISRTLRWFEDQLPTFVRMHKSMMVNYQYISSVDWSDRRSLRLKLKDNSSVYVSRRRTETVLHKLYTLLN